MVTILFSYICEVYDIAKASVCSTIIPRMCPADALRLRWHTSPFDPMARKLFGQEKWAYNLCGKGERAPTSLDA